MHKMHARFSWWRWCDIAARRRVGDVIGRWRWRHHSGMQTSYGVKNDSKNCRLCSVYSTSYASLLLVNVVIACWSSLNWCLIS